MKNWLRGETVILTGASSGIGRELCKRLILKYGANVLGVGRREERMISLKEELREQGEKFSYYLFDVGDRYAWNVFKEYLIEQNIQPKLLINNAGQFPVFEKASETSFETAEQIMRVNYYAPLYSMETVFPLLKGDKKNKAGLVNVSSCAALCSVVGTGVYSASKAALKGYTEALQMEQKGKTYVGLIYPGTVATELFDKDENTKNSALDLIAMKPQKMAKKIAKKIVKRRKRAVLGFDAKMMTFMARIAPVKGTALIGWVMKISKSKVFSNVFEHKNK
ncbi:MAG: SDR family NAD(P)-dependent oxidoreductase [Clostridia bacterium]|nr:SDR family NAD(P)-dependent oxidoreductase [Clostridia bacterium]